MAKLLEERHIEKLLANFSDKDAEQIPVVKIHLIGTPCTWLIVDIDPDNHDYAFGLADIGQQCAELGYIDLAEIKKVASENSNLSLERDPFFKPIATMSVYTQAGRAAHRITTDKASLIQASEVLKKDAENIGERHRGRMLSDAEIEAHFAAFGNEA